MSSLSFPPPVSAVRPVPRQQQQQHKRRRPRYNALPFFLSLGVLCAIVAFSFLAPKNGGHATEAHRIALQSRGLESHAKDLECRLVHNAKDKCAFVRANCPDEQAGLISYLELYYCRMPTLKPLALTILILWLCLLFSTIGIAASDFFCINLSTIASILGMSESMAGVTFLAFGNGSPDVFSTFAAMSTNSGSLAVGELIGAACFISAVVAGSMALVRPFKVAKKSFVRDVGFFVVAAAFSLVFLWDGKLYLWECAAMVGFYVFYVVFVVVWHWWLNRRARRRQKDAAARAHFVTLGNEEVAPVEEYHDDDDGQTGPGRTSRAVTIDDFNTLERGGDPETDDFDHDEDEGTRERWLGELSRNMRLSRPKQGERRHTHNPIRPSLVGALEFRAVLSGLQKSRNIQTQPINLRRYSDDPTYTTAQQQDQLSTISDPAARPPYFIDQEGNNAHLRPHTDNVTRARAVSANDAEGLRVDPSAFKSNGVPTIDLLGPLPEDESGWRSEPHDRTLKAPASPTISLSPPPSTHGSRAPSPAPPAIRARANTPDLLEVPGAAPPAQVPRPSTLSPHQSPQIPAGVRKPQPKLLIPNKPGEGSEPPSPFPEYTEYALSSTSTSRAPSLRLPPPLSSSPASYFPSDGLIEDERESPLSWWPYSILPSPQVLFATLFPTLYSWKDKKLWEKFLGVVAAPSVFLLTITLPVVEGDKEEDCVADHIPTLSLPGTASYDSHRSNRNQGSYPIAILQPDSETSTQNGDTRSQVNKNSFNGLHNSAAVAINAEEHHTHAQHPHGPALPPMLSPTQPRLLASPDQLPTTPHPHHPHASQQQPKDWNRWLVLLQTFTAPFFTVLIVWANTTPSSPRALLKPALFALLFSLVVLGLLIATTTPTRPPRWRVGLCFLGFAVSIAWISSIANEVVGVLKTLGVVLDISDAILGLTIFAVGNSLGDLVADITVARLGYPVMALSACFGGPMLNILLGIGLSGLYMTIHGARKYQDKHPDRPMKFKPYHVDVSGTLLISGITLLVTLLGLLVAVPARGWRMDRVVAAGAIGLWVVSTVGNVVLEATGWGFGEI
ncbi:hypothetical protein K402DRAFT_395652 [Aulographum hederae CBS 113979]|uniref:Sodium/calcium exchanger membrane region domain-containing protein n=1 Tax=Aulographum hederae CBS 113979 TaxID=1176131 RepID=A0A6G1GV08_9PEZI|nr:hypothetical protein K402DRAFT_395652 [Aulographum hederae CBS 113979]